MVYRRILFVVCCVLCIAEFLHAQTFPNFLASLQTQNDSMIKSHIIDEFLSSHSIPVVEDTHVYFVFRGNGSNVAVAGELNGWNPSAGMMTHVNGTNLFYREESFQPDARVEYKIWVDSSWMLDPLNPKKAAGGYGENSDVWMPNYQSSSSLNQLQEDIPTGKLDTFWIESKFLKVKHPVVVYTPSPQASSISKNLPLLLVTDGIDYLTFAKMNVILDNMIGLHHIKPVIAVFIEPRTILHADSTNKRMTEYAASDAYLDFLEKEVVPKIERSYPVSRDAGDRLIIGASMGGLISTYAVLTRPNFVARCGSQSPAYGQADSAVIKLVTTLKKARGSIYIQTGTLHDTQVEAKYVEEHLRSAGAKVIYEEFHEGHNWTNWKAHLPKALEYFFKPR